MILGLSGWMDGGDVSTGTVEYLAQKFDAELLGEINPSDFYIYNFPGSMEISSLFRPHVKIEDGVVKEFDEPSNKLYYCEDKELILLNGKEPNLRWPDYAEAVLTVATEFNVSRICFAGSVSSLVPHTREPRFHSSFSDESMRSLVTRHGLNPSNYEGPASIVTYMMTLAQERNIGMATVVAEIPAYVQGKNIKCISSVTRKIGALLDIPLDLDELDSMSAEFERGLDSVLEAKKELAEHIKMIEEAFDKESLGSEDSEGSQEDLKDWFENQGIRLD